MPPVLRFLPGDAGMLRPACPGLWWRCSEQCRTHTSFPEVRIMSLGWLSCGEASLGEVFVHLISDPLPLVFPHVLLLLCV